jgi:single-strand DNA-binding protein
MSQQYEITGTIKFIMDEQAFASGFKKRQFVVTTADDKYPQDIALEVVKDACVRLDDFLIGDGIKVTFNIRGNEYNGKYYVQLAAWKLEKTSEGDVGARSREYGQTQRATTQNGAKPPAVGSHSDHDEEDDIPF